MRPRNAATLAMFALSALLVLSLGGCTVNGGAREYRDPSVPIVVEKGEEFTIVLESDPSTGYRWQLGEELDAKVLELEKVEYEEPGAEERGKPGEEKWTFKAVGLGRTTVVLEHAAPGSGGEAAKAPAHADYVKSGVEEAGAAATAASGKPSEQVREGETAEAGTLEGKEAAEPGMDVEGEVSEEVEAGTLVFSVWVKKKGAGGKEPEKYEDPAEAVEVEEGYRFSIVLESDPTGGRQWWLVEPLDGDHLSLVSVTFEAEGGGHAEGEEGGAPGKETWTFEALRPGEAEVTLAYGHPWDREKPEETRTFKVEIKAVEGGESSGH